MIPGLFLLFMVSHSDGASFEAQQRRFPRVREAFASREAGAKALFARRGLPYPPARLFPRAFKKEKTLELWAAGPAGAYVKAKDYRICSFSGGPGPKRREGDGQVPEGFYHVDRFNPQSRFHLSLGLNYPNASDRAPGERGRLGGDIFIHGNCVSIGCLAMTDDLIREIYALAVLARSSGQSRIPVHIFPSRMNAAGMAAPRAVPQEESGEDLGRFWLNLKEGYNAFEKSRVPPTSRVGPDGRYLF